MLPQYLGDGRFYHYSFSRIGFSLEHAHRVSFIELLHVPTVGRSQLDSGDLSEPHLIWLNEILLGGPANHIFVPRGVARLMHASKIFEWLSKSPVENVGPLGVLYRHGSKHVYSHCHLSVWGKYQKRKDNEAAAIRVLADKVG